VYIFGVGGTLAIYQGVSTFRHAGHPGPATWSYVVLGIAAAFDFSSWLVSYRELLKRKDPGESTWDEIVGSKDPSVFTVFLEDSAGLIGVFIAFVGILLGQVFHNQRFDAAASILIGVLLAGVAVLLGRESGALLIGERTNRTKIRRVRAIISADPWVEEVCEILTMQLGPEQVLLAVYARFQQELGVQELESTVSRLEQRILQEEPTIKRVFIEAKSSCSAAKPHP
jgi:divalent metal cation (Fe/Co/Zn/Cd) transporter